MATAAVSIKPKLESTPEGLSPFGHDGVTFKFEGKTYAVEPKALSSKVMRALVRKYDQMLRSRMVEVLEALRNCNSEDEKTFVKQMHDYFYARMEKVMYMLQTDEGVAIVLHLCCPEIDTIEEAERIVDEHPSFIDLIRLISEATTLADAGN